MNSTIWISGVTFSLSLVICAVSVILGALKTSGRSRVLFDRRPIRQFERRKIKTNPNIVCGFPVYQKARDEAPF